MTVTLTRTLSLLVVLVLVVAPDAVGQDAAIDLGTLGGTESEAGQVQPGNLHEPPQKKPLNAGGAVVGSSLIPGDAARHAFWWTTTQGMVDLGTLGGLNSDAVAVNDSEQVIGSSDTAEGGASHAFSWTPPGGMVDLGTLGGLTSEARAVNRHGQVVGSSDTGRINDRGIAIHHAFSWTPTGDMVSLGTLVGGQGGSPSDCIFQGPPPSGLERLTRCGSSFAYDVNDNGQVVGKADPYRCRDTIDCRSRSYHAFSWTATGGMVDLTPEQLTTIDVTSEAIAVNNNGLIVGAVHKGLSSAGPFSYAFLWTPAGETVRLYPGPSYFWSYPNALNNSGQVVGWITVGLMQDVHAFSWTAAGGLVDLGTLGGNFSYAEDVNESGHVVGVSTTASGEYHAFVWTRAGGMVDLGTMGTASGAVGVNESGQVAGTTRFNLVGDPLDRATLWLLATPTDVTPPTLLLPAPIVVDGTNPAGATVTYAVSATDDHDPNPVVVCSPPSGSVFPLLLTTVSCTATDATGNSGHGSFDVIVRNPIPWTVCAAEGGVCVFTGPATVRYGANGAYVYNTLTDGTACTNAVFGDPVYGTVKECAISTPAETDWTFCAVEGGRCAFTGTTAVRYGANGAYGYQTLTDGAACTNAVFGDPISGTPKHCAVSTPSTADWTVCAAEGGVCAFASTALVRYGANGAYVYQTVTGGTACTNGVFGDPIYGTVKQCAISTQDPAALPADVIFTRSMEVSKIGSSYVATCNVEFTNVEPDHRYLAILSAQVSGIIGATYPYGGEVGPHDPTFIIDEPGVTRFEAALTGHRLSIERLVYFDDNGEVPNGGGVTCQGGGVDLTTHEPLGGQSYMTDIFPVHLP